LVAAMEEKMALAKEETRQLNSERNQILENIQNLNSTIMVLNDELKHIERDLTIIQVYKH
jgi:predicted  nucleic acid-binding Zn-ribbon protein